MKILLAVKHLLVIHVTANNKDLSIYGEAKGKQYERYNNEGNFKR